MHLHKVLFPLLTLSYYVVLCIFNLSYSWYVLFSIIDLISLMLKCLMCRTHSIPCCGDIHLMDPMMCVSVRLHTYG
jgi:hypothetical protein